MKRAYLEMRSYPDDLPLQCWIGGSFSFHAHWHNEIELLYVEKGSVVAGVNLEERLLPEGSLLVCASNDIHYYEKVQTDARVILLICKPELITGAAVWPEERKLVSRFCLPATPLDTQMEIETGKGTELQAEMGPFHRVLGTELGNTPQFLKELREIMGSLIRETSVKRESYKGMAKGYATLLLSLIERHMTVPAGLNASMDTRLGRMQKVLGYLKANAMLPLTMVDAARQANMSPTHFSKVFTKTVGMHFRPYLNELRLERAEEMLRTSHKQVTDIALDCGFESLRTFHRAFRKSRGQSPKEIRVQAALR